MNANGYENILFKYSNIVEEVETISSDSSNTIMSFGPNSGCVYAYQFREEIGLYELSEIRKAALNEYDGVRYQTSIKSLLDLLRHIYSKIKV